MGRTVGYLVEWVGFLLAIHFFTLELAAGSWRFREGGATVGLFQMSNGRQIFSCFEFPLPLD